MPGREDIEENTEGREFMIFRANLTQTVVDSDSVKDCCSMSVYIPAMDENDAAIRLCAREVNRFVEGVDRKLLKKVKVEFPNTIKAEYVTGYREVIRISKIEKDGF